MFNGWTRQKLIERIESLEKQAIHPKIGSNKENNELLKKNSKYQANLEKTERELLKYKSENTALKSQYQELSEDFEKYKENVQIEKNNDLAKLNEKIEELQNLKLSNQKHESGVQNVVDDFQNRLNQSNLELENLKNEKSAMISHHDQEVAAMNTKIDLLNEKINEYEKQIKELQQYGNLHEMDDSMEMLEIPNGTETTTLYSELEDQRLELSQKYNKLLRQYRHLRSQQSLYSMKSNQEVYDLEMKVLDLSTSLDELKLVKIDEMVVFKEDKLPNGELNYLSSGYGHKHELVNRMLHKQVHELNLECSNLRQRHLKSLNQCKEAQEKLIEMLRKTDDEDSPNKRQKIEEPEVNECKTQ
eukprot:NODE_588_length_5657_cov_0.948183.p2 type:complete len:359 gc:universal NODE_588_length_5657_cov_0.948183:1200-124(-)